MNFLLSPFTKEKQLQARIQDLEEQLRHAVASSPLRPLEPSFEPSSESLFPSNEPLLSFFADVSRVVPGLDTLDSVLDYVKSSADRLSRADLKTEALNSQMMALKAQSDLLNEEIDELNDELAKSQALVNEKSRLLEVAADADKLNSENHTQTLELELQAHQSTLASVKACVSQILSEPIHSDSLLSSLSQLESFCIQLKQERETWNQKLTESEAMNTQLSNESAAVKQHIDTLLTHLGVSMIPDSVLSCFAELKIILSNQQSLLDRQVLLHDNEVNAIKAEYSDQLLQKTTELEILSAKYQLMKHEVNSSREYVRSLESKKKQLIMDLKWRPDCDFYGDVKLMHAQGYQALQRLSDSEKTVQKLKESHHIELQSVKNYITAFKDSLTELYGAVSKLSNDHSLLCSSTLAEASTIYQESLNKIMHSKMEASSHEWDSLTQTLSNTQTEVARISLEFESLKARHNTLQNEMVQCEEKLKASERQCNLQSEQYLSEAESASAEICRLRNTFAELQSKYELLEFSKIEQSLEMEQLKSLKESLEVQFTETDSQLKKANADHGSLLSDLGHLIQLFSQDAVMEPVFESFEDMMDPIYTHFESLNSRFDLLNEKCSKLIIFKTEMDHIIQDLRATVSLRDTELDDAFEKTNSLESQVEEKDQMIQHLNWLLSQTKEQILAYETQNESAALKEEIFNLKADLDQKVTDLESASETLSTLNNKIAQLESEYDAIETKVKENSRQHELDLSKASEEIQDIQGELHHQQEVYKNTLEQHQAALNSLEADLASASALNSDLRGQLNCLESSLTEKNNELTNKLEEMARMEKDQMDLQATIQSAGNQITEMTEKYDTQQRKLQSIESQYESIQQKLMLEEESNVEARAQLQSLSESLNTQTSILHEISQQMKDMEVKAQSELLSILSLMNHNHLSDKTDEKASTSELFGQLKELLHNQIMCNSNLESEKNQLLAEIRESKISIESLENTLAELKSQLETQQSNCMSLEADKGKLLCEITDSKTLVASLENKLMEFKTVSEDIAEKENVLQDAMLQIEHLKRELAEWSEKVAAMEKEDATSKEQILHLTSQMETWMQKYETAMFDLETSKSQLDAKDHEMAQLCQNLTADREPSFDTERVQKLEAELEEKKMTISGFEQALLQAQEYMDEKDVLVTQKTDEIKSLRSQMEEIELSAAKTVCIEQQVAALSAENQDLKMLNESLANQLSDLEASFKEKEIALKVEIETGMQLLKQYQSDLEEERAKLASSCPKQTETMDQYVETEAESLKVSELEAKLSELESEKVKSSCLLQSTQKELDILYDRISSQEIQLRQMQKECDDSRDSGQKTLELMEQIKSLNDQIHTLKVDAENNKVKVSELESNLNETSTINDDLTSKYAAVLKRNKKLETAIMNHHVLVEQEKGSSVAAASSTSGSGPSTPNIKKEENGNGMMQLKSEKRKSILKRTETVVNRPTAVLQDSNIQNKPVIAEVSKPLKRSLNEHEEKSVVTSASEEKPKLVMEGARKARRVHSESKEEGRHKQECKQQ